MKQFLRYIILLLLFWLVLFAIQRTAFLIYNYSELKGVSFVEILSSYWFGLRMDIAAFAYLAAIPVLLFIINVFAQKKIWARLTNIFTMLYLFIVLLIGVVDTGLYSIWGSKLNAKAISYVLFPGEAIKATTAVPVWLFVMVFLVECILFGWIYFKWIRAKVPDRKNKWLSGFIGLCVLALLLPAIRGGFQMYPLGRNMVYYSRHMVLNYAALNGPWNAVDVIVRARSTENPYKYFDEKKALAIVTEMQHADCDSAIRIVNVNRPNIVLVLMESVSAENMQTLGGKEKIMPGLDSLTREGLLFTRFYATGFRTEQGIISYISNFPAQPTVTIMREFGKFEKLPNLGRTLADNGYTCNYYYTGNLDFANTRSYLITSSFTKLLEKESRPWKRFTQFGALDEELFQCHLEEAGADKQPFFSILMTSTSHEPFEAQVKKKFTGKDGAAQYKNTVSYTDSCLFAYMQKVKETPWYANTLFIITSDHAHSFPMNRSKFDPERHHIPFLIMGGALKPEWRGKTTDHISSQLDLAATLLGQLGINSNEFTRSKNMLDPCQPAFAFYTFDNGFGLITPEQTLVFDHDLKQVLMREKNVPEAQDSLFLMQGKAYLQVMFEEYLNLNR